MLFPRLELLRSFRWRIKRLQHPVLQRHAAHQPSTAGRVIKDLEGSDGRVVAVDVRKSSCLGVVQVEEYPRVLALVSRVATAVRGEQEIVGSTHLLRPEVNSVG